MKLFLLALAVVGCATSSTAAGSIQVTTGGRSITIPPPHGFVRCDGIYPDWDTFTQSVVPATNRRLATFGTPEDQAALKAGKMPQYDKSFNIQVSRDIEHREIGEQTFAQFRNVLKAELQKLSASIDQQVKAVAASGNKKIAAEFGVEDALKISNTVILGSFEETETSLGFTMAMKVQAGEQEESRIVVAALMTPVKGRLLNFYATAPFTGDADRQWAESAVTAWRHAAVAANPRVVGPSIGFDWSKVGKSTFIGAVVGGLLGLIGWLGRKAKRSA